MNMKTLTRKKEKKKKDIWTNKLKQKKKKKKKGKTLTIDAAMSRRRGRFLVDAVQVSRRRDPLTVCYHHKLG